MWVTELLLYIHNNIKMHTYIQNTQTWAYSQTNIKKLEKELVCFPKKKHREIEAPSHHILVETAVTNTRLCNRYIFWPWPRSVSAVPMGWWARRAAATRERFTCLPLCASSSAMVPRVNAPVGGSAKSAACFGGRRCRASHQGTCLHEKTNAITN